MNYDGYFYLGTIQRTYHNSGAVIASFDVDDSTPYKKLDWIFLEEKQSLVPYEVKKVKQHNKSFILELLDIDSIELSEGLVKKNIYLPIEKLPKLKGNQFYFHEVLGFSVWDETLGEIGTINELQEYPGQTLAKVVYKGYEVLLPLVLNWVSNIDRENKKLTYSLPQGYLDVYTSENSSK